ncbi:hypothetical protein SAMN05216464_101292 [Mucilaginibacter pineti]|uniref:Lipocalin-like domain-containing protein n=1 Tax=Mucilaginibacter pineti TaxID=1391627 RepID=A0A1G6TGM7_9SPHI|nr:hypothetical protein [Mucilaginibacter pineti]SDD28223.1 hypothetical protein SAMN05216464_101292 [Mucilaginibacter pineti]
MKLYFLAIICAVAITSCIQKENKTALKTTAPLIGTWHLVLSKSITKGVTTTTTPPADQEMIKMFNGTHFAFFTHDLQQGKVANPVYESGSGTYKLSGNDYTEHLAYCNYREWENRDFKFTLEFKGDTLIQKGIEKIEKLHINREIIEEYVKIR